MPLPPDSPPPVGPLGLAIRCAEQGADAQAAGVPLNACPYGPDRTFSRRAWVGGYVRAGQAAGVIPTGVPDVDESEPWPGDA